ncbi:MAG: hypothetical protein MJA32_05640, partial [Proteobacteria bacterium]|nr:hypothetical protein [Pseudomonadota bacterium]
GVMRPGIPVVFGVREVPDAIVAHADATGARLLLRGRDYSGEDVPRPGLPGEFQRDNAAAVIALLDAAGLSGATRNDVIASALPAVRLAGRGQSVERDGVEWLLDVAHNPAAAETLARTLRADPADGRTVAVIAALDDKDVEGIVAPLDAHVDRWIAVAADSRRAVPAGELARRIANACNRPCLIAASLDRALDEALREAREGDRLLITGSFYIVGPALQRLGLYSRPQS